VTGKVFRRSETTAYDPERPFVVRQEASLMD
jgi:hypothetical protein